MGYQFLANRYIELIKIINYLEEQIDNGDDDISTYEKLEQAKKEFDEVNKKIDEYNGVDKNEYNGDCKTCRI